MKSRIPILLTFAALAIIFICVVVAWRAYTTAHDAKIKQAKLATANAGLKERLQALNAHTLPTLAVSAEKSPTPSGAALKRETTLERMTREVAESALRSERLRKNPELQKKYLAAERVDLSIVYGPFFHKANLTADETAKLVDILTKRQEFYTDIAALRATSSNNFSDPIWTQLQHEARDEAKAAAQSLLGADAFAQFQLYERQKTAWQHVGHVAAGLALADLPMSFEQSDQLVNLMANASAAYLNGKAVNLEQVDWTSLDVEARKILTPEQFEFFSTTQFIGGAGFGATGGFSRWSAAFSKALNAAMNAEREAAAAFGAPKK